MRERKTRKGFSLIELLIAIVVLAILGAITISAGSAAQKRARITAAMTVFDNYRAAFDTAVMDHPGLVNDREDTWTATDDHGNPAAYTSVQAFSRLVGYMNKSLSEDERLVESADGTYYESVGNDPWGGKYVLLEYPIVSGVSYYDPTSVNSKASMRLSIWCTGLDSDIILPDDDAPSGMTFPAGTRFVHVRDISVGVTLVDAAGNITSQTHGDTDGVMPFVDAYIPVT